MCILLTVVIVVLGLTLGVVVLLLLRVFNRDSNQVLTELGDFAFGNGLKRLSFQTRLLLLTLRGNRRREHIINLLEKCSCNFTCVPALVELERILALSEELVGSNLRASSFLDLVDTFDRLVADQLHVDVHEDPGGYERQDPEHGAYTHPSLEDGERTRPDEYHLHQERAVEAPRCHVIRHEGRPREPSQDHAAARKHFREQNAEEWEENESEPRRDRVHLLVSQTGLRSVDELKAIGQRFGEDDVEVHAEGAAEEDYVDDQRRHCELVYEGLFVAAA